MFKSLVIFAVLAGSWNLKWFPSGRAEHRASARVEAANIADAAEVIRDNLKGTGRIMFLQELRSPQACSNLVAAIGDKTLKVAAASAFRDFRDNRLQWQQLGILTDLPVIVKGIQHPDDAEAAIEAGADAIWVSNHGGRQLDGAPASIEVLPEIAARVNKRVPIIFDSGIRNGTHIFKAIASGADIVAIGRPVIYALSLGGWMGVVSLFDYLKSDLRRVMWLAGAQTVEDIKNTDLRTKCMMVRCAEL